jgi:hypothetical protein
MTLDERDTKQLALWRQYYNVVRAKENKIRLAEQLGRLATELRIEIALLNNKDHQE